MLPNPFVPARSSRHRLACLALYRALVREGQRVPLPDDVLASGTTHPIKHLVRRQFRRNKGDVSKRLVYSALSAGYKVGRRRPPDLSCADARGGGGGPLDANDVASS
jgi:hypothetical protein